MRNAAELGYTQTDGRIIAEAMGEDNGKIVRSAKTLGNKREASGGSNRNVNYYRAATLPARRISSMVPVQRQLGIPACCTGWGLAHCLQSAVTLPIPNCHCVSV